MVFIDGKEFTLFWDLDRQALGELHFAGRVEWLRCRLTETLLKPLDVLEEAATSQQIWLATTELVCAGIDALGGFYGGKGNGVESGFCRFVTAFMHGDFRKRALDHAGRSQSYCWHLQEYFRNGLDHGFSIEWGRLWLSDAPDFEQGYLRPNANGSGIAVCPRSLLTDFRQAAAEYFRRLESEGERSLMGQDFSNRFELIRAQKGRR